MPATSSLRDPSNACRAPTTAGGWNWQDAVHSHIRQAAANSSTCPRRFDRVIGVTLGGIVFGTGGCILGACMSYRHPVGITLSMLWWGIYFGCFGVWLGAVLGASVERIRNRLSERSRAKADKLDCARPAGVTITRSKRMGPVFAAHFLSKQYASPISTQSLAEECS
jgi:hypothetical protein